MSQPLEHRGWFKRLGQRLLDFIGRLCFQRLLDIAAGWRLRLRQLAFPEDIEKVEKLQDSLGTSLQIKIHFSDEGAFVPFEWSTGVDECAIIKHTPEKEIVIQDDLNPGKTLTFNQRHVRYLPVGIVWGPIMIGEGK